MVNTLYIDSRKIIAGTPNNFTYQLPRPVEIPQQSRCFIDAVMIPNVFPTIHGDNNAIYLVEQNNKRKIILTNGVDKITMIINYQQVPIIM